MSAELVIRPFCSQILNMTDAHYYCSKKFQITFFPRHRTLTHTPGPSRYDAQKVIKPKHHTHDATNGELQGEPGVARVLQVVQHPPGPRVPVPRARVPRTRALVAASCRRI